MITKKVNHLVNFPSIKVTHLESGPVMNRDHSMFDLDWKEIAESPGELWDLSELKDIFEEDDITIDDQSFDELNFDTTYDY